jgi:sugar lactone lactonase YvrE
MSPYNTHLSLAVVLVMTACLPQRVHAQNWVNGQPASFVIGQTGFNLNIQNEGSTGATGFNEPEFVVVDPATGKVFVSDAYTDRILRFPSTAAMTNGAAAEAVLGQVNFYGLGTVQPPTAATLDYPGGMAIDASGNLWVADETNMRVLRYANAATIASGAPASEVLGQPDFVSYLPSQSAPTAASMYFPCSVFCSGTTLWVSDEFDDRILRFDNAASKANGAPADAVFGVPNFVYWIALNGILPTASNSFSTPNQIYVDASDNLWVADVQNNRVLMFPNASFAVNAANGGIGGAATLVLGQTNFTDNSPNTTASTMHFPAGVYGDAAGNIYVSEYLNSRILVFMNAASLSNGAAATYVLGQPDFVSNGTGDGASQLANPYSITVVSGTSTELMVADLNNYRVTIFTPPTPLPLLLTSFTGRLQNNGQALLQWQVPDEGGMGVGGYTELEYATHDTSGFTDVLNQQSIYPAIQNYSYLQVSPAPGANYYRLKVVAPDGSATYSQIVTITIGAGASTALTIYPNPAQSTVVVTLPQAGGSPGSGGSTTGTAVIEVYNSAGGLMQRLSTASTVNTLSVSGWAAGLYTVRVTQGGMATTGNFIKIN